MEILILLVAVSFVFVGIALGMFVLTVHQRTLDHADRLSLLPLDADRSAR